MPGGRIEAVRVRQLAEANQGYESIGATADTARRPEPGFATLASDGVTGRNRLADRIADGRA